MKNTTIDINENSIKKYVESLKPEDLLFVNNSIWGILMMGKLQYFMKFDLFGTTRKKFNTWNLLKLDFTSQDKNGIYIGCVQAEDGNFTNHFQNQLI